MWWILLYEFKLGPNFTSWQCSVTFCLDDTAEAHWFGIWDFATSIIFSWSLTNKLPFSQTFGPFLRQKHSKEVETAYKDLLAPKPFVFYRTGINNLFNWWQKYINVQRSFFGLVKSPIKFINSGKYVYSKIGLYFPSNLIIFTNPSARAGYDTRSIFKRSLIGLNSGFSFS